VERHLRHDRLADGKLVTLAKSWNYPPRLEVSDGFEDRGYDRGQRAFVLQRSAPSTGELKIRVAASKDSPVYNPALVILDWGFQRSVDDRRRRNGPGSKLRIGHRHRLDGSDLILWIEHEATEPFEITLNSH
jgi:hypothetical protein